MINLHFPSASLSTIKTHFKDKSKPNPKPYSCPKIICKKIEDSLFISSKASPVSVTTHSFQDEEEMITKQDVVKKLQLLGDLRQELMPRHVAIIMDGHGRWAKNRGMPAQYGHYIGFMVKLKSLILSCCALGMKVFTVYAFSCENWGRLKEEVDYLMSIYEHLIQSQIMELINRFGIRFSVIRDKAKLPKSLQHAISLAEEAFKDNVGTHFIMAVNYSGKYEITEAVKKIACKIKDGELHAKDVNVGLLEQELDMAKITKFPTIDLLIRTSGELRLSNFMLWESAYSEFYFSEKLLPDFREDDLVEALRSFQLRKTRYGGRKN